MHKITACPAAAPKPQSHVNSVSGLRVYVYSLQPSPLSGQ